MGRQHLSGNGRRSVTLEKPWAQLACEGKESSPAGWHPRVRTWGCPGWAGLIQEPCSRGDRKVRGSWVCGVGWLSTFRSLSPPFLYIPGDAKKNVAQFVAL